MEDDGGGGGGGRRSLRYEFSREPNGSTAGLTLGGILSIKEASSYRIQNRTLLDLIRNDPTSGNESNDSKKSWKMFREKLRLKLAGSVCTTTTPILASLVHINTDNNRTTTENGTNLLNSPSVSTINGVPVTQTANSTNLLNSPPVSHINTSSVPVTQPENRTNLLHTDTNTSGVPVTQTANYTDQLNSPWMSNSGSVTVTQTVNSTNQLNSRPVSNSNTSSVPDTQTVNVRSEPPVEEYERTTTAEESRDGGDGGGVETVKMSLMSLLEVEGSAYFYEEEVAEGGGGGGGGGGEYNNCCVCMVRHKGAAFIPCGHTFCRLCSRELFVKRANCPLCNNFILEILDIF